jgi:drug/metabolite transporter (DMT)-like permease
MGLLDAAMWAAIVIISKRVLRVVDPIAFNLIVRLLALAYFIALGVPLTAGRVWSLDFDLSWPAFGYMAAMATITWLIAFNAYYYALHHGQVSVVGPITSTDPVFTAVFSFVLLGTALGGFTIAGLIVTVAGVFLIARWMGTADGGAEEPAGAEVLLPTGGEAAGDGNGGDEAAGAGDGGGGAEASAGWRGLPAMTAGQPLALRNVEIVGLAVTTAAAWGAAPILIQAAMDDLGGPSIWMLMLSQGLGALILAPVVWRRRRILIASL